MHHKHATIELWVRDGDLDVLGGSLLIKNCIIKYGLKISVEVDFQVESCER